ncbi:MAG: hypothetical protein KAJ95_09245, partial [Gammaproteobacteria bacterium]|nr:hypothetical protein [Gammaproteobacteria bacterium]
MIVSTGVGAAIDTGSGPFQFKANTSLRNEHYTKGTFSDQQYFDLAAIAGWEMLKDRVDWTLEDFFSQQTINSLNPDTPDNTQDTNVLTLGANVYFPISGRQSVTVRPEYQKFTYDVQSVDSQQNSLNVNWDYKMFRAMSVGLAGSLSEVKYDEQAISDIKFRNIGLVVSGERSRSNYSFNLGVTHASRDDGSSSDRGFAGNMIWLL